MNDVKKDIVKLWSRQCSVTGEGMNEGWCWGDGVFYTKNLSDTLKECRKDRDSILIDINSMISNNFEVNDADRYDEFKSAVYRANRGEDTDEDLLMIAFQIDYLYYTDWDDDDDDLQYAEFSDGTIGENPNY